MYNWKRYIEYSQYDSKVFTNSGNWDIRKEQSIKNEKIEISFFQLLVSTAKGLLTRAHKYSPETAAFARVYMNIIPFLLSEKNGCLVLNNDNKNLLRDFSKSTRHGEIAQGINYFLAKNYLDVYVIYDFQYWCKMRRGISQNCKGRTPDYVLGYSNKKIGLMESKGTVGANPTRYMISGHEQCESGKKYLNDNKIDVYNSYVSAVSFATSSPYMKRNTHVYIADPKNEADYRDNEDDMRRNRLYEYSKWFYLTGKADVTKKLMVGENITSMDLESMRKSRDSEGIIIDSWELESGIGEKPVKIILGIKPWLGEYLVTGEDNLLNEFKPECQEEKEIFKDGTFIRLG